MDATYAYLLVLAILWLAYFAIHSILASLWLKQKIAAWKPSIMPAYRAVYNLAALILLIPPLWMTFSFSGPWLWRWQGSWFWISNILTLLAIIGFLWSLRHYDGQEFLGLRQWRLKQESVLDQERFQISPLHRFVRHPWYFLGLIILWTRDINTAWLVTISFATLYFILGSRLEEAKLLRYHGKTYRRYRERVPGLLPLPWRFLSKKAALEMQAKSNEI